MSLSVPALCRRLLDWKAQPRDDPQHHGRSRRCRISLAAAHVGRPSSFREGLSVLRRQSRGFRKLSKSDERYISRMLAESDTPEEVMSRASFLLSIISEQRRHCHCAADGRDSPEAHRIRRSGRRQDSGHLRFESGLLQRKLIRVSEGITRKNWIRRGQLSGRKICRQNA